MFGWLQAVRVVAPVAALLVEGPGAAIGAVVVQEGGLWLGGKLTDACQRRWVSRLFLAAYGLRVVVALPVHYVAKLGDGNGAVFQDDYTNDLVAEWLVRISRGEGLSIFAGHQHLLASSYTYVLMGLYAVFGHVPLLPKLLNCVLGALAVVLVYEIARHAFRPAVALVAAVGATVIPTLVLWSVVTLKENLVLVLALAGLWALQQLMEEDTAERRTSLMVLLVACMAWSLDLRSTTSLILVVLVPLAATRGAKRWQVAAAGAGLVVLLGGALFVVRGQTTNRSPAGVVEDVVLQIRHRRAQEAVAARSQIRALDDVVTAEGKPQIPEAEAASDATPFTITGDVLEPLGFALLAPAPWQAHSLSELAVSGEMLGWYVMLLGSAFALRAESPQRRFLVCLAVFALANWLVLAASEGNLGNLLRHRLLIEPPLLILGCAGLDWLWPNSRLPWSTKWTALRFRLETAAGS